MEIVTWNAQGMRSKLEELRSELVAAEYAVLLAQEVTAPPPGAVEITSKFDYDLYEYNVGTTSRPSLWYIVFHHWRNGTPGNPRCSLATFVKGQPPASVDVLAGDRRPVLAVQCAEAGPLVCNLHATSGFGGRSDALDLLQAVLGLASAKGLPWVLAGDFNTSPGKLDIKENGQRIWTICPPAEPTHGKDAFLDYAVRALDLAGSEECTLHETHYLQSDHRPQRFRID